MSKANQVKKLTVTIKRLSWDFNLYWKLISKDEDNDKNKKNILPPPLSLQFP